MAGPAGIRRSGLLCAALVSQKAAYSMFGLLFEAAAMRPFRTTSMKLPVLAAAAAALFTMNAQQFTRGIGVYPGRPAEDFSPVAAPGGTAYRNLALRRPAWHSSAYDYNLTAQLITDGIVETRLPRWFAVSTSRQGTLRKQQREWLGDDNWVSRVDLNGRHEWIRFELGGGEAAPTITRLDVDASVRAGEADNQDWSITVFGSGDGSVWTKLGQAAGMARPTGEIRTTVPFAAPARFRQYRLEFDSGRALTWQIGEVRFWNSGERVRVGGPHDFASAWMSAGSGEEWVSVDLGAASRFDRVVLHWIRPAAEGVLEISDDGAAWTALQPLPASGGEIRLSTPAGARWARVRMTRPASPGPYMLSEFEVYGTGGVVSQPKPALAARAGRLDLAGGAWRLERESQVKEGGEALSRPGYRDRDWLPATVPGTVLASYHNAGALPDPNFGDNQLTISDSFFQSDFWYRNEFTVPEMAGAKRLWLHFDGINWKADVFLNGAKLGRIEGGFLRGRFDVTGLVRKGAVNAIAVRVEKLATPGSVKEKTFENPDVNGGAPGADNPTYHASIGWDWIPTIRGRNTGIWNDVYVTASGGVTIENPAVSSTLTLPDISTARVTIEATLRNHEAAPVSGNLRGRFGDLPFEVPVTLAAGEVATVKPVLTVNNPKLWWPNGYGEPDLYLVEMRFEAADGQVSDSKAFQAGVRQFAYSEDGGALRMWVNGRRFIPRGGNWGFGESMLRYRGREYDAAVRYHRDMHFNMIRNWVGQIGDDEFYEACDRHGIVVWQDFWLANPWDGPEPDDNAMFMANVRDTLLRIRHHASLGLYCGRNEGYPLPPLDRAIRAALAELHPGIHYISSSADDGVSGHGPYRAMPVRHYFDERATPRMHSEMGMPNIVSMDSLKAMMPRAGMWPQGAMWGLHDFCLTGAQGGASFRERIERGYGGAATVEDWVTLAQFINYEGHRAMFEAQGKNRMGLLMWMSHPAWPSMVWQTYDYFLEPTAGYFAAKKASEPLHIQWNPVSRKVEVVNYSGGDAHGLTASAGILNLDGTLKWEKTATLDSPEDSVRSPIQPEFPEGLGPVYFLRLKLERAGEPVSENFYWLGRQEGDFRALRKLEPARVDARTTAERQGSRWVLRTVLRNQSQVPALMVRLKAVRQKSGDRVLPVLYQDNYLNLMPGESRTVETEVAGEDTRGEVPDMVVEGFNLSPSSR